MRTRLGIALIVTGLIMSLGVGVGLWFVGDGFKARAVTGVTSTGSAVISATADTAVWSLTLTAREADSALAAKLVATALPKVRKYFVNAGMTADQLTVGSLNTYTMDNGNGGQVTEASVNFSVRSADVQKIATLNAQVMDLLAVAPGVNVNTNAPQYYLSNLDALRPQVQKLAVTDARARADVMAAALGVTLGKPLAIDANSISVTAPDVIEGDYGGYDLSTIAKKVRAVVSVKFEVQSK
jgi:uncharacterized protein YggE